MITSDISIQNKKTARILLFLGVIFFASNLRAPLTSVGPVIGEISEDLGLSNVAAGLVTTIPLLAFGFLSALVPRVSQKKGMERVLLLSLFVLIFGLFVRSWGSIATLFLGAAFVGVAITVGNVLMPAFIKEQYPQKMGLITGIYMVVMNLVAALAAGFSIPLGEITGLQWQGSIGIWIVIAILSVFIWWPQVSSAKTSNEDSQQAPPLPSGKMYKSGLAWAVTIFMGLQSLLFYSLAAWLPKAVQGWGMSSYDSGWVLSVIQLAQLPVTLIGAVLASKMKDQKVLVILTGILFFIGLGGILIWETKFIFLCSIFIGIAGGMAFSLATLFLVLRTENTAQAAQLSGMAQGIGYLIAGTGPAIFGHLFDLTNSWTASFLFLIVMAAALMISGLIAGRNQFVH